MSRDARSNMSWKRTLVVAQSTERGEAHRVDEIDDAELGQACQIERARVEARREFSEHAGDDQVVHVAAGEDEYVLERETATEAQHPARMLGRTLEPRAIPARDEMSRPESRRPAASGAHTRLQISMTSQSQRDTRPRRCTPSPSRRRWRRGRTACRAGEAPRGLPTCPPRIPAATAAASPWSTPRYGRTWQRRVRRERRPA